MHNSWEGLKASAQPLCLLWLPLTISWLPSHSKVRVLPELEGLTSLSLPFQFVEAPRGGLSTTVWNFLVPGRAAHLYRKTRRRSFPRLAGSPPDRAGRLRAKYLRHT